MHERLERPEALVGATYKIKSPLVEHAMYVTINDIVLNAGTEHELRRPFEVFINSKNMDHFQWVVAITRSEEHTSELQSLMRLSYAVSCLQKQTNTNHIT